MKSDFAKKHGHTLGDRDFSIDLLFYHLHLHCYVLIDLKKGEFKPEYAGKMNFYLGVADDQFRHGVDAPSLGLILCQERNRVIAEYALGGTSRPIGISEYGFTRALPPRLRSALPTVEQIEAELSAPRKKSFKTAKPQTKPLNPAKPPSLSHPAYHIGDPRMKSFYQLVGERALRETRSVTLPEGTGVPAGEYAFMEFYCEDPACDCRRVIFQVWRKDSGAKSWATITYGWDMPEYYAQWSHCGPGKEANEMASATLEQMSPQTKIAGPLLNLAKEVLLSDPAYVARLMRHYQEACPGRNSNPVSASQDRWTTGPLSAEEKRRASDPLSAEEKRRLRLRRRRGRGDAGG